MLNNIKKNNQAYLELLIAISRKSQISQRKLAQELGFSVGKLNYCIKELHKKGLIKIQNFNKSKKKSRYLYFLTPQGIDTYLAGNMPGGGFISRPLTQHLWVIWSEICYPFLESAWQPLIRLVACECMSLLVSVNLPHA